MIPVTPLPIYLGYPTNFPPPSIPQTAFNVEQEVHQLHHAMQGIGTDEHTLIKIIAHKDPYQMEYLKQAYETKYGRSLASYIKNETSFNFKKTLISLLCDRPSLDADILHDSISGAGTDEHTIISILVARNNAEKQMISKYYHDKFGKSLEHALENDTSGDFKKLLKHLMKPRNENYLVNPDEVRSDAERLYNAGEGRLGTDEPVFYEILCQKSYQHIVAVANQYPSTKKHNTLTHAIKKEFSGYAETALLDIITYAADPIGYAADIAMTAMKGAGTNDRRLILTVVSYRLWRNDLKKRFHEKYGKSLAHWIKGETSGDYEKALRAIIDDYS